YARLYTEAFEPMQDPTIKAYLRDGNSQTPARELLLRPIPEQPGMYRGELVAPGAGAYSFGVDHDKEVTAEFAVEEPKQELAEARKEQPFAEKDGTRQRRRVLPRRRPLLDSREDRGKI